MSKPTKWHLRPAKTQISLGIRPVWSESLLSAWWKLRPLAIYWAHSEDSDQTGRMPKLIWVFAGRTCHFVGFVMRRLIYWHNKETSSLHLCKFTPHECIFFHSIVLLQVMWLFNNDMWKPTKWPCAQRRLRSAWAFAKSDQNLRCPHEESLGPKLPIERRSKTLIRLGGCPGWSESSLGAYATLLVLSWGGSYTDTIKKRPLYIYVNLLHTNVFFFLFFFFHSVVMLQVMWLFNNGICQKRNSFDAHLQQPPVPKLRSAFDLLPQHVPVSLNGPVAELLWVTGVFPAVTTAGISLSLKCDVTYRQSRPWVVTRGRLVLVESFVTSLALNLSPSRLIVLEVVLSCLDIWTLRITACCMSTARSRIFADVFPVNKREKSNGFDVCFKPLWICFLNEMKIRSVHSISRSLNVFQMTTLNNSGALISHIILGWFTKL